MEAFSITGILELLFAGIASAFGSFVEETVLGAAQVVIDLILGITPGLTE